MTLLLTADINFKNYCYDYEVSFPGWILEWRKHSLVSTPLFTGVDTNGKPPRPYSKLAQPNQHLRTDGEEVIQGLTKKPKTLSSKYFYDDRGSELFEQICELPEYWPARSEALIWQQYADKIAELTGDCELVELGSGNSAKTLFLLDAYQKNAIQ